MQSSMAAGVPQRHPCSHASRAPEQLVPVALQIPHAGSAGPHVSEAGSAAIAPQAASSDCTVAAGKRRSAAGSRGMTSLSSLAHALAGEPVSCCCRVTGTSIVTSWKYPAQREQEFVCAHQLARRGGGWRTGRHLLCVSPYRREARAVLQAHQNGPICLHLERGRAHRRNPLRHGLAVDADGAADDHDEVRPREEDDARVAGCRPSDLGRAVKGLNPHAGQLDEREDAQAHEVALVPSEGGDVRVAETAALHHGDGWRRARRCAGRVCLKTCSRNFRRWWRWRVWERRRWERWRRCGRRR